MRNSALALVICLAAPAIAQQPAAGGEAPLSAIDWLRPSTVAQPAPGAVVVLPGGGATLPAPLPEPPAVRDATSPSVTVTPLDAPRVDAVGLLPSHVTGLPATLWSNSRAADVTALIAARRVDRLPAMQALFYTLLLAEAEPTADAGQEAPVLQARIDALMRLGAVEPAQAMLDRAGPTTPDLFRRWFDATLLTGDEDQACAALAARPHLAPDYAARVFCTARRGDWNTAALTLDTARALGFISDTEDRLLAQFLDPEMFGDEPLPLPPVRPSPLMFRLYEAAGEPLPTTTLPRAFAMADLRPTAGWRAELISAERLTQTGALSVNRLLGVYKDRRPAASGGIWDRVAAIQRLDAALGRGDAVAVSEHLPPAWAAMRAARLEVAFAELYAEPLLEMATSGRPPTGRAAALIYDIALLGAQYESAARALGERHPARAFETALAKGAPPDSGADRMQDAIARGFAGPELPPEVVQMLAEGRLGEVILQAMAQYERAAGGDLNALPVALATLRHVGLEDSARRAALQMALLRFGG